MKKTPLFSEHIKLKARMVEFGGWEMPVQYSGVLDEHLAVRNSAGIFDVSHMGEFEFKGKDALECAEYLTTNDISKLGDGRAVYSLLCNEKGGIVDDVIVYRFNAEHIMLVVNAANIEKDWSWVTSNKKGNATVTNKSDYYALIALQGPKAAEILQKIVELAPHPPPSPQRVDSIKPFYFACGTAAGVKDCIIARTGYTGEDGFEIFCPPDAAPKIWEGLLETGRPLGLKPAGLGARDTLRLEMKYSLYGHEISDETNPHEAGLSWVVKINKTGGFIGKEALEKIKAEGVKRKCVGFQMLDQGIPRQGYRIFAPSPQPSPSPARQRVSGGRGEGEGGGVPIGTVCSGTMSPSLGLAIGTGYVPVENSAIGSKFFIDIRGKKRLAEVTSTPFYKKG